MGERFVSASFTPATTSSTQPTVRSAIVSADDPGYSLILCGHTSQNIILTTSFARVEPHKEADNARHDQQEAGIVKFLIVLPKRPQRPRVKVQEEKQEPCS
jgi:hypothetical protein